MLCRLSAVQEIPGAHTGQHGASDPETVGHLDRLVLIAVELVEARIVCGQLLTVDLRLQVSAFGCLHGDEACSAEPDTADVAVGPGLAPDAPARHVDLVVARVGIGRRRDRGDDGIGSEHRFHRLAREDEQVRVFAVEIDGEGAVEREAVVHQAFEEDLGRDRLGMFVDDARQHSEEAAGRLLQVASRREGGAWPVLRARAVDRETGAEWELRALAVEIEEGDRRALAERRDRIVDLFQGERSEVGILGVVAPDELAAGQQAFALALAVGGADDGDVGAFVLVCANFCDERL